ncbi:MAG: 7-carboxy-7-deazaguanine synthase [Kistimonas sp.]|nr:7-carboxy-7-deazaguanine synthase [Kistimonas sp.]
MYSVKEMFYTLQGEGHNSGRPAVFCRFSGCNLWSGREQDRHKAVCRFCDTDFRGTDGQGGGTFRTPEALAAQVLHLWGGNATGGGRPLVVCTGGEPLLQLDTPLIEALQKRGFEVAIETNGTLPVPAAVDWSVVSPKAGSKIVVTRCDELKLVFPQAMAMPSDFEYIEARYYYLSPVVDPHRQAQDALYRNSATRSAVEYCLRNPRWRLNLQCHKILDIA